jgi:hypothetical protein
MEKIINMLIENKLFENKKYREGIYKITIIFTILMIVIIIDSLF